MEYKALMLDIDGTLIPYEYDAIPSINVSGAIKKAEKKVSIFLVTGRAFNATAKVREALGITSGLIVTNAGACVIDIESKEPLYDCPIEKGEAKEVTSILKSYGIEYFVKEDFYDGGPFYKVDDFKKAYMIFSYECYSHETMVKVFNDLSKFSNIALHKTKHKEPDKYGVNITHINATKLHGIEKILETVPVKREEIIGVGDGYNDFPLLMACGLKVAMGNAIPDLKEVADYIAPSVDEDGVAHVIEKFILSPHEG
ncbi:MAG: HAD family hydrolase [Candidatus Levyibacteriota bacterium]